MTAFCHPGQRLTAALLLLAAGETGRELEESPHVPPGTVYLIPDPGPFLPPGPVEIGPPPRPRLPDLFVADPRAAFIIGGGI